MRQALLPLFLLGLTGASLAPAQPPDASRIQRLIAQLGSGDFQDRESAMAALHAIGSAAMPALRAAARSNDLELRRRAEDILHRIERREESARLLAGKRIRLAFQDTPIIQALAELNRLTGFAWQFSPVDLPKLANTRITLRADDLTVWEALDRFCAQAGLALPDLTGQGTRPLVLAAGKMPTVPTCHAGAIRLRALVNSPVPGWGRTAGVYFCCVSHDRRLNRRGAKRLRRRQ
jgi:hypothetical protein